MWMSHSRPSNTSRMALESSSSHESVHLRHAAPSLSTVEATCPCSPGKGPASSRASEIKGASASGDFRNNFAPPLGVGPSALLSAKHDAACNAPSSAGSTSSCSDMEDSVSPDLLARGSGAGSWCSSSAAAVPAAEAISGPSPCDDDEPSAADAVSADATADSPPPPPPASLSVIGSTSLTETPPPRARPRRHSPASSHASDRFAAPSGDFGSPSGDEQHTR